MEYYFQNKKKTYQLDKSSTRLRLVSIDYFLLFFSIFLSLRILLPVLRLPLGHPCLRARGLGIVIFIVSSVVPYYTSTTVV